ncbi:hypothetical protein DERP_005105 [Dermatophagoides pteronyssinus]|uniref:Uncharacterized protein n=1 Tax=Dermatophagoides pteronyssinus TaxID=6956 RepID=A0ABQ8JTD9_DERPT|nr:hypothetical protein DERP_005105 [Dermatophagoides pteronyssinus]
MQFGWINKIQIFVLLISVTFCFGLYSNEWMDRERKKTGMNLNGMSQIYDYYDENKSSMKWNE